MAKKSQTTGIPKDTQKKAVSETSENASAKGKTAQGYRSRAEREARIQRWIILGTGIAAAVIVALIIVAFIVDQLILPNQAVAQVQGTNITVADFQKRVLLERTLRSNQISSIVNTYQSFGFTDEQIQQQITSQEPYATWIREINVPEQMGVTVLNLLIDDQLVRNEAAARNITITDADIDKKIQDFFGYDPEAIAAASDEPTATLEPTTTPTPFVSPTPSPTPTETAVPTATPTPEVEPTATLTPVPTVPPEPTLTGDEQAERFASNRDNFFANLRTASGMSDADLRRYFEMQALRDAVRDAVSSDVTLLTLHADVRHILVPTQEQAQDVLAALQAGESFADLARAVSTDTGSATSGGELGWSAIANYVKPFADAVRDAEIGELVGPIDTTASGPNFGFHILQVRAREERELDENSLERIKNTSFAQWLEDLNQAETAAGNIQTFDIWSSFVPG